jgi:hypothetical protein
MKRGQSWDLPNVTAVFHRHFHHHCRDESMADWRAIADASVDILAPDDPGNPDTYLDAVEATQLPDRNKRRLQSLFSNAIILGDGRISRRHRRLLTTIVITD